ncbi:hypothetical protein SDJN02_19927, partial [Cucurbita argyrosperma subsp. argyrosperma]
MALKSAVGGKFRAPPVVPASLMIGFVMATSFLAVFPAAFEYVCRVRGFERVCKEYDRRVDHALLI